MTLLFMAAAFLIGSFPTGALVARAKGIDLRKVGSGNIGATNVGRALGKGWAALVLVVDAGKGALPVLLAHRLSAQAWLPALAGIAAVLGQVFSVFLRGRGGKGVATSLGAGLALAPLPAVSCLGVFVVVFAGCRIVSLGSLAGLASFSVFLWLYGLASLPRFAFGIATLALVTVRHKDNLRRLMARREPRL
ncbi:MAG: glycerol-3-phosphate 1-O-acyltransferase PlsY [Polyangia bacterium]|jgi:glycerol-3-phosphate acyltransferase PlsY